MGNLVLNLDAQLLCFETGEDSKKFAIEKISFKKLKKVGIILFSCWTMFLVTEVLAEPFVVYKDGKKLKTFFDNSEPVSKLPTSVSSPFYAGNLLVIFSFLNSLRESTLRNEVVLYLRTQELNKLKKKEVLITLLVQGGEIAKSLVLLSYTLSIFILAISIYLGQKEEMQDHFKTLRKKRTQVFVTELLTILFSILVNDSKNIVKIFESRQIQISPEFFFSYLPKAVTGLVCLIMIKKYGRDFWSKSIETWEELPRILSWVTDFIISLQDGDWTYKIRRKKLIINTARLRKELSLEKRHPRLSLKDWFERTYSILIAEGRIKDYENALRHDLLARLQFFWFIFKENKKVETPLSDLEWFFVLTLLYNNNL